MKNQLTNEVINLIDWNEFFRFWKFKKNFPEILQNEEANKLFNDANNLLKKIQSENISCGEAIIKEFCAKSENDNIIIHVDDKPQVIRCLRQQTKKNDGEPYLCLSDFIDEKNSKIGIFAITSGSELEKKSQEFAKNDDSYNSFLYLSVSERIVEAFSQYYQKKYFGNKHGIAFAIGYPSLPDLRIMQIADKILDLKSIGITLNENCMMSPISSVCGFYITHPKARYFAVGKISEEQLSDYAARGNESIYDVKKWIK